MRNLFEVYTRSGSTEDLKELYGELRKNNSDGLHVVSRLCVGKDNKNILVEMEFPMDEEFTEIYLTVYSYDGNIKDYHCENEIGIVTWDIGLDRLIDAEKVMMEYALMYLNQNCNDLDKEVVWCKHCNELYLWEESVWACEECGDIFCNNCNFTTGESEVILCLDCE